MIWDRGLLRGGSGPSGPKGHRAYAVGDIHGRLDLLDEMLALIVADNSQRPRAKTSLIFLGDLIDRGPDSAGVVERLRTFQHDSIAIHCLAGNHEEVLLRILDGDHALIGDWVKFGGSECLRSYGVDPQALARLAASRAIDTVRRAIPSEHQRFLRSFVDTISFGSFLFVHAGVRPGVPLSAQTSSDLRWIRQPFLDDDRDHGQVIVHGHTIRPDVDRRANRIGIDTGAYCTGRLTALAIEGRQQRILQCGRGAANAHGPSNFEALSEAC